MGRILPASGFFILSITTLVLFGLASYQAWFSDVFSGVIATLIFFGLLYKVILEGKTTLSSVKMDAVLTRNNILNFSSVFLGALVTYTLSVDLGLGAVVAAGVVGILAAILFPSYGVPIYCGAFVGMTSSVFLGNHYQVALGAFFAGIIFVLATGMLDGFGGKLGTIAYAGCILAGLCLACEFIVAPIPGWDGRMLIILYSIAACVSTFSISIYLKQGPVMASGVVGLVGGLVLPVIHPGFGETLAVLVICASFAGMSSTKRFPKLWPLFVAGVFTGIIFIYTLPFLGGAGGKLGTIGFGSVIAMRAFLDLMEKCSFSGVKFPGISKIYMFFGASKIKATKRFLPEKEEQ